MDNLTWISGFVLLLVIFLVGWWSHRAGVGGGHGGGCCGPGHKSDQPRRQPETAGEDANSGS